MRLSKSERTSSDAFPAPESFGIAKEPFVVSVSGRWESLWVY